MVQMAQGDAGQWVTQTVTVYTTLTLVLDSVTNLAIGSNITIAGNSAFNGANLSVVSVDVPSKTIKVAYTDQAFYSGSGGTVSITAPTLARNQNVVTANTAAAHGLNSGDMFSVTGVTGTVLGGTISSAARVNNIATITTSAPNGVRVGSILVIASVTDTTFNGTWTVTAVVSATAFQVTSSNLADASSSGGTVTSSWNNTQRFVISAPTTTSFTYADTGPDAQTTGSGTITPVGQVAGGERTAVCLFETDYGYITPPSEPIKIVTAGTKKVLASNIPIGPSNVVKRIIAFTGIDGSSYHYIPVPARSNGNVISTSTVIEDNTSTSAIFDFSDNTLLSSTAIDDNSNTDGTLGYNLFRSKILGNCSGVFHYADRTIWWGDENVAINFRNMGFEGGTALDGSPMGWTVTGTGIFIVPNADFGDGVLFAAGSTAILSQPAYLDYYGDAILEGSRQYTFKMWQKCTAPGSSAVVSLVSGVTTLMSVTIPLSINAGFVQATFPIATPAVIPADIQLQVQVINNAAANITLDEFKVIFADNPFIDTKFSASYINDPETIDSITGICGAAADTNPIMDAGINRDNLVFVTRDNRPDHGKLHYTKDLEGTEPSGWTVTQVSDQCGACSMFSMTTGQGWLGWVGRDGARIYDGSIPQKITQDIQSDWESLSQSNLAQIWGVTDTSNRRIYWGVPRGSSGYTDSIYVLDFRYGETGSEIEDRASIRVSPYTGKMLVLELSRKFTIWTIPATAGGYLTTVNGSEPCFSDASGRTYRLDDTKFHDDDYGTIPWYYVTSPFVSGDMEQQLQLGNHRHFYSFLSVFASGVGKLLITPLVDALDNPWPARGPYSLSQDPNKEMEMGLEVSANRAFYKFSGIPLVGSLDSYGNVSRMEVSMQPHPMSPVRGRI